MEQMTKTTGLVRKIWKGFGAAAAALGLVAAGSVPASEAGEFKVSGFADIIITLSDESSDDAGFDADGNSANSTEEKTSVTAEVDFEYVEGPVTFRLDLDVPSLGNEAAGVGPLAGDIGIEQAKFIWAIPGAEMLNFRLTGGAFNAPIGFEAQDAPDLLQVTNGQLWALVPSNIAGVMVSGGVGPVNLDLYAGNEWRNNDSEENSFGALLTIAPIEAVSLSVGYLAAPDTTPAGPPVPPATTAPTAKTDGSILDVVLSGTISPKEDFDLLLVGEFLQDEFNTGWAIVANAMHNTPSFPHGLTIRYDSVDAEIESVYGNGFFALTEETNFSSLTVAVTVGLAENLSTLVEWKRFETDASVTPDSSDLASLEFIATF